MFWGERRSYFQGILENFQYVLFFEYRVVLFCILMVWINKIDFKGSNKFVKFNIYFRQERFFTLILKVNRCIRNYNEEEK